MSAFCSRVVASAMLFGSLFIGTGLSTRAMAGGLTPDLLVNLQRVSAPELSPDGKQIAFTIRDTDLAANRGHTEVYVVSVDGGAPRRLTSSKDGSHDPHWSPTGDAVYFLSTRDDSTQVYRQALGGVGDPVRVTDLPVDVEAFAVSPTGDRLALALAVFRDCPTLACTHDRLAAAATAKPKSRLYTQLFIRHWDTWADGRRNVLYSVELDKAGKAVAVPTSLSGSLDGDVPAKPFGDAADFTFSPDGKSVAFSVRVAGREEAWSTNFDIYEVASSGGTPVNLTAANKAWDAEPRYSPDGRTLAYRAMDRAGFEADRFHLVLRDRASGASRTLAGDWDRSVGALRWTTDGTGLVVSVPERGQQPLYRVDVRTGARTRLTADGTVDGFDVRATTVAYALNSLSSPNELYAVSVSGTGGRRITAINGQALAGVEFGTAEQFSFTGAHGETVYGYVVKPAGLAPGQRVPVAFIVHGGPQSSFANDWSFRWNPQIFAAAGYGVVFIDFHGSTGYGQAFTDSISGDWGGKPLEDLKKGLAAAEQKYPWLDGNKACALGASYGGYMINWIAGNWSDRFRCLVNHDGIFDARSMAYSTEELWFDEWEHGGPYYAVPERFEQFTPSQFVTRWQTPMLVIHGEQDFRVPLEQGIATFTALQRRGIESKLLIFPDENHWVLKPGNSLTWHRTVLGWLDEHLKH